MIELIIVIVILSRLSASFNFLPLILNPVSFNFDL